MNFTLSLISSVLQAQSQKSKSLWYFISIQIFLPDVCKVMVTRTCEQFRSHASSEYQTTAKTDKGVNILTGMLCVECALSACINLLADCSNFEFLQRCHKHVGCSVCTVALTCTASEDNIAVNSIVGWVRCRQEEQRKWQFRSKKLLHKVCSCVRDMLRVHSGNRLL